jgi:hypothetical protein
MFPTATLSRSADRPIHPPGRKKRFAQDGAAIAAMPLPEAWRSRPLGSARCGPSRDVVHHSVSDPSNYLG